MERATEVFRARWLIRPGQRPIRDAAVRVADGRVVNAGPAAAVVASAEATVTDLGAVALVPGFVNTHTHLDLSTFSEPLPITGTFADWLHAVVSHRRLETLTDTDRLTAATAGCADAVAGGATVVGDIAASDLGERAWQALGPARPTLLTFREVVGLRSERWQPLLADAAARLSPTSGISPHAPYSTHLLAYQAACARATAAAPTPPGILPMVTHWLESPEEQRLLATGDGPLADFLQNLGAWPDVPPFPVADPWATYLRSDGTELVIPEAGPARRWLLVHGNYLGDDGVARVAEGVRRGWCAGVVYCPRTHAAFGHAPHPWLKLLEAGVPVALGTDSRASNPDLRIFEEARFLVARFPEVPEDTLLRMLTSAGRQVLGLPAAELAAGGQADMVAVRVTEAADRMPRLFADDSTVVGVWSRGVRLLP